MDLIIRRKNSSIQFQFLALFILLDIFCTCSCDKFQRKLITTNQGSDISTDWKPLSIRDLKPPSSGISLHQGFISLSNSLNRNKLQQFGQLPHSHNSHILRSYQTHPQWNQNHHHHQFAHISPIGSHLPIQIPRFNQLTIPSNLPNLPVPVVPHTLGNGGISANGGGGILMKSPPAAAAAVSKSLIKSEPYGGPMGVVKPPAPLFDVKQIHSPISKSITYNGLYTTTAKIPTPHHIRSPQLFKTFNNYALSDAVVFGGFSTSPSIYGPTSPKAPILGHQNFLGHTVIPTFKKYPVTNPPTGLGTYHHRHHLVPSSFISYSYPLAGKITNHFQTQQAPAAITTVRTHQTTSPPDNLISKHQYHVKQQQENSNILKVEPHSNSFQWPSSSEPPFVSVHQNQQQHQNQNQNQLLNRNKSKHEKGSATENDDENIEIISNSSPQVLPPVPASVLTPFFVPIDSQNFLNANSNKNHSDQSKNELFTEIDSLLSEDDYQSNDDSSVYTKNNAINLKDTSVTTTINAVENYENFNKKDASSYISDVSSPSPSPAPPKFNEISGGNFNSISSTIRPLYINNYRDQSNFVRPPNFKLEKFNSVFSTPRSTSHSFFPTSQNSFNSFFTLEDAVTINPFREFSSFDEINKIPEIPVKEKPINLDPPTPTNHQMEVKINHNRVNQPIRHRSRNRTESTPPTPSSTFQTYSRDTASYKERLNQTEKKPNNFAANRNPNRIESSTEKSEPTVENENRVNKLRMKSNYKNSKRYQIRRNNTMDGVRFSSTIPSFRQSITSSQLPTLLSTAMTSPAVASSATSERATPISRINKIQYTRIPPSLKPIPPSPSQIPHQVASAEEIPMETTQTSTVTSTISFGIPTTTLDLQETPTPTFHNVRPTEQQININHSPTISSTEFQSQSSSASPIVETTKKRQRIKYRNQENEANKSTSKESLPEDTKSSTSPSIQSTSESIKKINPSDRPKFSIRNYRRPLKNATISSSSTPPTTTTPAVTITRSTTSSTESSVEISSSASTDHDRVNSSYTTRKRLFPSMKFRTNSSNNNTSSSSLENNRHKGRPNLRDSSSENLNSNTESKTNRDRGNKNHRDSNNSEMRPTRRRIPENRRVPYSNRNRNRGESSTSSKENDVYSNTPPSSPTPSSSTLEVPTIKSLSTSLSRRPPRISLKDRIQNHLNRKSSNDTQSNQMFDDLLNITLETRTNSVESTTSTSTPKIESAIMKIAKDDSHSHQRSTSTSTSTMNINNRSRSSSSSTPLTSTSTVSPTHTKSSVSFSTLSSTSSISSTSSSSSSSSSSLSSSSSPSFPGGLDTDPNLVDDMSNISRYVDELTASSSTNSLNILNRGLHTRRIPNYFTLATEDPILPIEAFFPNVLKENNKINES